MLLIHFPCILFYWLEFRKYNAVVFPTDARGSTYIPVLFRPTGFVLEFVALSHFVYRFVFCMVVFPLSFTSSFYNHFRLIAFTISNSFL